MTKFTFCGIMFTESEVCNVKFGDILKDLRKKSNMTQDELAQKLNVAKSTISMYERGERLPSFDIVTAIADIFRVDVDVLYGRKTNHNSLNLQLFAESPQKGVKIPVLGNVAAGIPLEAITDVEDYEEISEAMAAGGEYVALRIHGDSMEPRMQEGDVVIVRVQGTIESGETAIVMVNGDEATCKRVKITPDGIMLISNNPDYEPMFYSKKQVEELPVRIFGKVVELRAKFR